MRSINIAVLRDGRRGPIVAQWDDDEIGSDVMCEVALGDPALGETLVVPVGDVYTFDLSAGAPRLKWRPVDVDITNTKGWKLTSNISLYVHPIRDYFAAGVAGSRNHVAIVTDVTQGPDYLRDQFECALLAAEMQSLTELHIYIDDFANPSAMFGGWVELVERDHTGRLGRATAAPTPTAKVNPVDAAPTDDVRETETDESPAETDDELIELALSAVREEWITPGLEDTVRAVSPKAWSESVVSPGATLRALSYCAPAEIKLVILGQDPYPRPGKANGLAFGLSSDYIDAAGEKCDDNSSFGNIRRELADCGYDLADWTLESLAREGVLLLNTVLSCAPEKPKSHFNMGWEEVVEQILLQVPAEAAWIAWGSEARILAEKFTSPERIVATSHPMRNSATRGSTLAPAFVGSKCFTLANDRLAAVGLEPVDFGAGGSSLAATGTGG